MSRYSRRKKSRVIAALAVVVAMVLAFVRSSEFESESAPRLGEGKIELGEADKAPQPRHASTDTDSTGIRSQPVTERHNHAPALKVNAPERDVLGLLQSPQVNYDSEGYPQINTQVFTFSDTSNFPQLGESVRIRLTPEIIIMGKVITLSRQEALSSLGFQLLSEKGESLTLHLTYGQLGKLNNGFILSPDEKYSYTLSPSSEGAVQIKAVEREGILPNEEGFVLDPHDPLLVAAGSELQSSGDGSASILSDAVATTPLLESRPGASGVIYLDFDGHTTTGTIWNSYNGGAPIVSAAAPLNSTQITEVWQRVSESFSPLSINVTTSLTVFRNATENQKIRVVISPTSSWFPNAGGVAFLGSWQWLKGDPAVDQDTPTYVFSNNLASHPKYIADATTHEVGHTLGLNHDGRLSPAESYYQGQNVWAPNMGAGYYKPVVQWSKGEYASANNTEDDIAIMSSYPGVDVVSDTVGDTLATALPLAFAAQDAQLVSLIESANDVDIYSFSTSVGNTTISADSTWVSNHGTLNLRLRLYDASGVLLATAAPTSSGGVANLDASLGSIALSSGSYYIAVDGPGEGTASADGYSSYGSIGSYTLTVTVPAGSVNSTPTSTPTPTPTHTSTPTHTPTAFLTSTPQPTATSTPHVTFTPTPGLTETTTVTPTSTPTATETNTPQPSATATATNTSKPTIAPTETPRDTTSKPIAFSARVNIKRDATARFSLDAEDPDNLPSGGIADVVISRSPRYGSVAPIVRSDSGSRSGSDSIWSYALAESSAGVTVPLLYNEQSRTFTRSGGVPTVSEPAILSRNIINLSDQEALIAETTVNKSGTVGIFPVVATNYRARIGNPDAEGLGITTYLNGEPVSARVLVSRSTTLNPGFTSSLFSVEPGDTIRVVFDRQGNSAQWQMRLFYATTSDQWQYELFSRKGRADFLEFIATDGRENSDPARIDFIPNRAALTVKRRLSADDLLVARIRGLLIRLLASP